MQTQSLWLGQPSTISQLPKLEKDLRVDVAIIGGGITGITAGILLMRAGKSVAVLENARVGAGETGHTTAHLTEIIDTRYYQLISDFGRSGAKQALDSSRAAIDQIQSLIAEYSLEQCAFSRVFGYLYTDHSKGIEDIEKEAEALKKLGVTAQLTDSTPLPFPVARAIQIPNQAQFQPYNYVVQLASILNNAANCAVYEHTRVTEVHDGTPCTLTTDADIRVTATDVIVAANAPVNNWFFLHTKNYAYRTYALAAKLTAPLTRALYWDNGDPYHYIRTFENESGEYVIVGGEDHKTGTKTDTLTCYENLEKYTRERFAIEAIPYRWSGQIIEPADGLPYIGLNSLSKHTYVATGFTGNGMTFGTLAGMLITDQILGVENEWHSLYAATRIHPLASASNFVSENVDFPTYYIKDRISGADTKSVEDVRPNEGKLVTVDGEKCAVFRDAEGHVHTLSAVCPHMGCLVHWNNAEQTWDCPCHGSRFDGTGKLLNGPALTDLKALAPAKH